MVGRKGCCEPGQARPCYFVHAAPQAEVSVCTVAHHPNPRRLRRSEHERREPASDDGGAEGPERGGLLGGEPQRLERTRRDGLERLVRAELERALGAVAHDGRGHAREERGGTWMGNKRPVWPASQSTPANLAEAGGYRSWA
jgi:hypothetical protein